MDHLPIELYRCIFRYLSIDDLFNCRLVNKKFKFSTYECINRLVIGESNLHINDYFWFNNEPINNNELISLERFSKIRSIFNLDNYLKCLKIWLRYDYNDYNDFTCDYICEKLWTFDNLINLECFDIFFERKRKDLIFSFNLNLKNLKYFKFYCRDTKFKLETPKLERIDTRDMESICIKSDPKSIKHLIIPCDNYHNSFNLLKQFKNLEIIQYAGLNSDDVYLEADPYIDIQILNKNNLSYFNNLKQLKFSLYNSDPYIEHITYRIFEKNFDNKFNDLKKLKREIDIYFQDVKIINIQKFKEFKSYRNSFEYHYENFALLDTYSHFTYFELDNSSSSLRNDLPSTFSDKYIYVTSVFIESSRNEDRPIDADFVNYLLNNLKFLKRLHVTLPSDLNFLNNLPNSIRYLDIVGFDNRSSYNININFNFILKLTELIWFCTSLDIDLFDLALESFSNLKYLKKFRFNFYRDSIEIRRIGKQFRFVSNYEDELSEEDYCLSLLNYDQFIQKLYEIKFEKLSSEHALFCYYQLERLQIN